MSGAAQRAGRAGAGERVLDTLDRWLPKPAAWAFAIRIWLAMMQALYAAFRLQLDSASSAAAALGLGAARGDFRPSRPDGARRRAGALTPPLRANGAIPTKIG